MSVYHGAVLRILSAGLSIGLATAGTTSAQVAPPRDAAPASQQKPAVGTAVISGSVMMAGSTQPARKVRVSLSGAELRGGRTGVTDDQGRFSFTALPAGRYNLSATKPGHVTVTYGQRRPGRPGTAIQLSDGQKFQADLQIPKGSVITGTVLDENGEPAPQTQVRVMRVVVQNGRRTLQSSNGSSTDDRGIYRAFGLLPGEYVVCATPRNNLLRDGERMVIQVDALQRELEVIRQTAEREATQAAAIASRIAALREQMPEGDESAPGYSPICYPGTAASSATPVTLAVAEERPGIDFQLQLVPLARVEGTVVNSTGADLREISVTLSDAQETGLSVANISSRADAAGRFRLMNVPPGQYRVTARATIAPPRPQATRAAAVAGGGRGRGEAPALPRPEPITVLASTDIVVDGVNIANVMLSLQQGVSLSGQLAFDGTTPQPADLSRVRVTLSPVEPRAGGMSATRTDASGRFTIPSVPAGRYRLSASGASGWFVESAMIGGQDALDFPFDVKGNQALSGALITFTDRQTELTGIVTNDKNQPAPEFTLVIFPADSRYWTGATSRRVQSARPATDGRYSFLRLPPGDYRLAPVYDLEPGALSDPAFLQQLEGSSIRVTIQPGEKKTQDMRVGG